MCVAVVGEYLGVLNPMRDKKGGTYRGGNGRHVWPWIARKFAEGIPGTLIRVKVESKSDDKQHTYNVYTAVACTKNEELHLPEQE